MKLLEVKALCLSINGTQILQDISFSLASGNILGVIGESGSGKSLTAFSIMQLLPNGSKTQGSISLDGEKLSKANEERMCQLRGNDIGMVFQEPMSALNPVITIGDQVAEAISIHSDISYNEALKQAAACLERVELPNDQFPLSRFPGELSGGQRQRVVIAMAIAMQPKLIIADEPTTALDVTTQAQILKLLKKLVEEDGCALMLITHDLAVVANLADDVIIMKDGKIVESGKTQQLFATMKHPYTKALFEASSHVPERKTLAEKEVPICQVENVVRRYQLPRKSLFGKRQTFDAVRGISFTIHKGESLGLVGESGCGKSTLMRTMLGLDPIHDGNITIDGQVLFNGTKVSRATRQKIQAVFQDPYGSFNPRHRVERIISEPMHLLEKQPNPSERSDQVAAALEDVGMKPSDAKKYIHQFSGGQRQRIAIARALIIKPQLIIMDEAVSALDVSIRAQILDLLATLSDKHALAYLFISHDLSVVRSITDRVLIMRDGRIIEQGETDKVFSNPKDEYTKSLLNSAPRLPSITRTKNAKQAQGEA